MFVWSWMRAVCFKWICTSQRIFLCAHVSIKNRKTKGRRQSLHVWKNGREPRLIFGWHMLVRNTPILVSNMAVADSCSAPSPGQPHCTGHVSISTLEKMCLCGVKNIPICFNMQIYGFVRKKNATQDTNVKEAIVSLTFSWYLPGLYRDVNLWFLQFLSELNTNWILIELNVSTRSSVEGRSCLALECREEII